eukprot:gene19904-20412_t
MAKAGTFSKGSTPSVSTGFANCRIAERSWRSSIASACWSRLFQPMAA